MKITIESTTEIVSLSQASSSAMEPGIQCRVWEGVTEHGVKVQCLIPRIAALKNQDLAQFEAELEEQRPPSVPERAFPMRMIL